MKASFLRDEQAGAFVPCKKCRRSPGRIHRSIARGLTAAFGILGMVSGARNMSAQSCCSLPMYIEYQEVSTNRHKTGTVGFLSMPPNFYRQFRDEAIEDYHCPAEGYYFRDLWTNTYPTEYSHVGCANGLEWGCSCISDPPTWTRNMWVINSCSSNSCSASYTNGAWDDGGSCFAKEDCTPDTSTWSETSTNYLSDSEFFLSVTKFSGSQTHEDSQRISLSSLYSTANLISDWRNDLESLPWPGDWATTGKALTDLSESEKCVEGSRMKYRIRYMGPACERGELTWIERFTPANGPVAEKTNTLQVVFTGAEQITDEFVVEPPAQNGCITIDYCSGGGCGSTSCTLGYSLVGTACGPNTTFNMGHTPSEDGFLNPFLLVMSGDSPADTLATPQALSAFGRTNLMDVITDGNGLRQMKTDSGLADVQVINATSYRIDFYTDPGQKSGGLWQNPGGLLASWTVTKTASTPFTLQLCKSGGTCTDFIYATNVWTSSQNGGQSQRTDQTVRNQDGQIITNIVTIKASGGPVVRQEATIYTVLSGQTNPLISKQIVGQGAGALTNLWFYYVDLPATNINYGKLRLTIAPSGAWERYEYDSTNGRPTKTIQVFLNGATNAAEADSRVIEYHYTPVHPDDTGSLAPDVPRTVVEKLKGHEIRRQFLALPPSGRQDIQCATPNAAWTNADNLVTTTRMFTNSIGSVLAVTRPDGTMQITRYATNFAATQFGSTRFTNTVDIGQSDGDPENPTILDGTRTITTLNPWGKVLTRASLDMASQIALSGETYSYDSLQRLVRVDYSLDGTYTTNVYDCCHLASGRDREGIVTSYTYDGLDRVLTTTRAGLTTSNVYDAAGNVLAAYRFGSNPSEQPIRVSANKYDTAGRILISTNALNYRTTYAYTNDASGRSLTTITAPNGGTRVETRNKDESLSSVSGTGIIDPITYEYDIESESGVYRAFTREIHNPTNQWTKTYTDMLGRSYLALYAAPAGQSNPFRQSFYNNLGQRWKEVDPDGVTTIFEFNAKGEIEAQGIDMNRNGSLETGGSDRRTRTSTDYSWKGSDLVRRTRAYVWNDQFEEVLTLTQELQTDGRHSWTTRFGRTTESVTTYDGQGWRTNKVTAPDLTTTVQLYQNGRLTLSVTSRDGVGTLEFFAYAYDTHARQQSVTDNRTGTVTIFRYDKADQVLTNRVEASGLPVQETVSYYNNLGRVWRTVLPDSTSVTNEYYTNGLLKKATGSRTYPVQYAYDAQGRMTNMTTWQDYGGGQGTAVTTWKYDGYRGFLTNKVYADSQGPAYTYTRAGRLLARVWARGVGTTNLYNNAGEWTGADYSDTTPDVTALRNNRGLLTNVTQGSSSTMLSYNDEGRLLSEMRDGLGVARGYDDQARLDTLDVMLNENSLLSQEYGYDAASRLEMVWDGASVVTYYGYVPDSLLVENLTFQQDSTTRLTTTRSYDTLNRLVSIVSSNGTAEIVSAHTYQYNSANQRTTATLADGSNWRYAYDKLGQVTSGRKYWADGTPVAGQQFDYNFDDIGNRKFAGKGGDQWGANLRYENYTANSLNQYSSRTVPGGVDIMGAANSNATVIILTGTNGVAAPLPGAMPGMYATSRKGEYFRGEAWVNNGTGAVWLTLTNSAVLQTATNDLFTNFTGNVLVPKTPEAFAYDADGNLTNDGRWSYTWDAENRLVRIVSRGDTPTNVWQALNFAYDWKGRRMSKVVSNWTGSAWTKTTDVRFVYDGWNLLALLNPQSSILQSFVWGLDLSASLQGAGGVGGLLEVTVHSGLYTGAYVCAYDGNGNLAALVGAANGTAMANYQYGPFAEPVQATGPLCKENPFRFSTKYQDDETALLYYGYRYLGNGRWLSRDPLEERASLNVYSFVRESPVNYFDSLGLSFASSGYRISKYCGVEQFIVEYTRGKWPNPIHIKFYVKFKNDDKYDRRCCEFKQIVSWATTLTHDGTTTTESGGPIDDGYTRPDYVSLEYSSTDDPLMPARDGDFLDWQFTATQIVYSPGIRFLGFGRRPPCFCQPQTEVARRTHTVRLVGTVPDLRDPDNTLPKTLEK